MIAFLVAFHVIAGGLWVGSMFFAFVILRVTAPPEPPIRLALWSRTLTRFFPWVWAFIAALVLTGYAMIGGGVPKTLPIQAMEGIGWLMFALFGYLSLRLLPLLRRAVGAGDWPSAGKVMATMRPLIAINLVLGLVVLALGASARYVG